ncbi:MAG: PEP-CTERM sorting domain-containing protein [Verrucomicrobia bacterium]|nr:PEP-CTERM sorting domain-containing protein [Verrucomicrobiota bacterium]
MKKTVNSILLGACLACHSVYAANTAIDATLTAGNQEFGGSLGLDFIVHSPISISQIGAFDDNGDGMNRAISVGIFRRNDGGTPADFADDTGAGAILGLTNFTTVDPGTLQGSYRFKDTSVTLDPGNYTVVGWGYGAGERIGNDGAGGTGPGDWPTTTNDGGGQVEFVGGSRFGDPGAAGSFPGSVDGGPPVRYGAGNFVYDAVPEPSTFGLLALAAAGFFSRRRRN